MPLQLPGPIATRHQCNINSTRKRLVRSQEDAWIQGAIVAKQFVSDLISQPLKNEAERGQEMLFLSPTLAGDNYPA